MVGENPTLYSHVKSPNSQLDLLGLDVYALVATHDGWYPVYEYGTKDPIAYTKLNKGDVYKIGETQHPKTRYSQVRLDEAGLIDQRPQLSPLMPMETLFLQVLR